MLKVRLHISAGTDNYAVSVVELPGRENILKLNSRGKRVKCKKFKTHKWKEKI